MGEQKTGLKIPSKSVADRMGKLYTENQYAVLEDAICWTRVWGEHDKCAAQQVLLEGLQAANGMAYFDFLIEGYFLNNEPMDLEKGSPGMHVTSWLAACVEIYEFLTELNKILEN